MFIPGGLVTRSFFGISFIFFFFAAQLRHSFLSYLRVCVLIFLSRHITRHNNNSNDINANEEGRRQRFEADSYIFFFCPKTSHGAGKSV